MNGFANLANTGQLAATLLGPLVARRQRGAVPTRAQQSPLAAQSSVPALGYLSPQMLAAQRAAVLRQDHFNAGVMQGNEDVQTATATGVPVGGMTPGMAYDAYMSGQRIRAAQQAQQATRDQLRQSPRPAWGADEAVSTAGFRIGPQVGTEGLMPYSSPERLAAIGQPPMDADRTRYEASMAAARAKGDALRANSTGKSYGALPFAHDGVSKADAQRQAVLDAQTLTPEQWAVKYGDVNQADFWDGGPYFMKLAGDAIDYDQVSRDRHRAAKARKRAATQQRIAIRSPQPASQPVTPSADVQPIYRGPGANRNRGDFTLPGPPPGASYRMGSPRTPTISEYDHDSWVRAGDAWVQRHLAAMESAALQQRRARSR